MLHGIIFQKVLAITDTTSVTGRWCSIIFCFRRINGCISCVSNFRNTYMQNRQCAYSKKKKTCWKRHSSNFMCQLLWDLLFKLLSLVELPNIIKPRWEIPHKKEIKLRCLHIMLVYNELLSFWINVSMKPKFLEIHGHRWGSTMIFFNDRLQFHSSLL